MSVSSDSHALVAFDDGNSLNIALDRIIVCDLLPVGMTVLAPRSDDARWSELAEVTGHYETYAEKGHTVMFISDQYQRK